MLFANNCNTTLNGGITAVATSMVVTSATGFPSPTGSQYFYCTLADAATQTTIEIVKVTAVSGTTFTIVRGQDGTTGTIFASGAVVSLRLVAASLNDFPKLDENNIFTSGFYSTGSYSGSYTDGIVTDYTTGTGRFSVGTSDGFAWYNGGVASSSLMALSSAGLLSGATWNGATVGVAYGGTGLTSLTTGYIPYGNGTGAFSSSSAFSYISSVLSTPSLNVNSSVSSGTIALNALSNTRYSDFNTTSAGYGFSSYSYSSTAYGYIAQASATFAGGSNTDFAVDAVNNLILGAGNAEKMRIASTGIVTMNAYGVGTAIFSAAGVISSVSDETWKIKDGVPVNSDEMLQKLEPGYWFYNEEKAPIFGKDRQLGFYAQNVNAAIGTEAAPAPEEGKPWGYYDRSVLAVTVMSLKNALKTIKELNDKFDAYVASHP